MNLLGNIPTSMDFENLVKTDQKSLTKAATAGLIAYMGADTVLDENKPEEAKDVVDDVITTYIAKPLGEMLGDGNAASFFGVLAPAYMRIGNKVADAIVNTEDNSGDIQLTSGSVGAIKFVLGGTAAVSQLVNYDALRGDDA